MAALAAARNTSIKGGIPFHISAPVAASTTVWAGSICIWSSGFATPAVSGATEPVIGICTKTVVNSGSAGAVSADFVVGVAGLFDTTGLAQSSTGKLAYITDDHTFTMTGTSDSAIGTLIEWVSATQGWVFFDVEVGPGVVGP